MEAASVGEMLNFLHVVTRVGVIEAFLTNLLHPFGRFLKAIYHYHVPIALPQFLDPKNKGNLK
jgi:uncharacterized membrane protein